MKVFIKRFFESSYKPLILFITSLLLFIWSLISLPDFFLSITILLFLFCSLVLFCFIIYQLIKTAWAKALISLVVLSGTVFLLFEYSYMFALIAGSRPDEFTNGLTIPNNIQINLPLDEKEFSKPYNFQLQQNQFQLYNSFQPGIYNYRVWLGKTAPGSTLKLLK